MVYEKELAFVQSFFKNFHIQSLILTENNFSTEQIDLGLRRMLGLQFEYDKLTHFLITQIQSNHIYQIKDGFLCNYYFMSLPDTITPSTLIIGPFLMQYPAQNKLWELSEKYSLPPDRLPLFEKYFEGLPLLADDTAFINILHTLGEKIWGNSNHFVIDSFESGISDNYLSSAPIYPMSDTDTNEFYMKSIETRYSIENEMLLAVTQGKPHVAEMVVNRLVSLPMERRAKDSLRNLKNYTIIMNTLLRKAAEQGFVHPFHIDKISSDFGRKIELATSEETCYKLQHEMIRKYCLLVKNYSMKGYSQLIQKVITQIDSDLSGNLSLNAIATKLNVNPSYLSSQFKKETGSTLTEYVNKKRVEHAILLLNSTTLQIQTIASHCGISDVNYFTKIFKKYIRKTPKEYRDSIM